ncbi:MAG: Ig-like domain-containing protein, partial [bacterium]
MSGRIRIYSCGRHFLSVLLAVLLLFILFTVNGHFADAKPKTKAKPKQQFSIKLIHSNLTPLAKNLAIPTGVDFVTSPGPFVGTEGSVVKQGDILVTNIGVLKTNIKGKKKGKEKGKEKDMSPVVIVDPTLPLGSNVKILTSKRYRDLNGDKASDHPNGVNFESSLPWIINHKGSVSVVGIGGTDGYPPGIPVEGPTSTGVFKKNEDLINCKQGLKNPTGIDYGGLAPDEDQQDNFLFFVTEYDGRIMGIDFTDGVFKVVGKNSGLSELKDLTFIPEIGTDGKPIPGTGILYVIGRKKGKGVLWTIDVAPTGPIGEAGTLVAGHISNIVTFDTKLVKFPVGLEMSASGTLFMAERRGFIFEIDAGTGDVINIFFSGLRWITGIDIGDIDGGHGEELLITDLQSNRLYVFDLGPELTITQPDANSFVHETITLKALVSDPEGVAHVDFYADTNQDGEPNSDELFQTVNTPQDGYYPAEFDTNTRPDGDITFIVEAVDTLGFTTQQSVSVIIDNTSPTISDVFPPSGIVTNTITISANYSDSLSGIDMESIAVTFDGEDVTADSTITETGLSYTPTASLADDPHNVRIDVYDIAGNLSTEEILIHLDTAPPVITQINPQDNSYVNTQPITVTGHVDDPNATVFVTTDVDNEVTASVDADGNFTATGVLLAEGSNTITVTAHDIAGNNADPVSVTVTLDTIAPVIEVITPVQNELFNITQITVAGRVIDANRTATVTINEISIGIDPNTGAFTYLLDLSEGKNTITLETVDRAGNPGDAERVVYRDTTPPEISQIYPPYGAFLSAQPITVTGHVDDPNATVFVTTDVDNEVTASVDADGNFTATGVLLAEGSNTITVT